MLGHQTVDLLPTEITEVKIIQVKLMELYQQKIAGIESEKQFERAMDSWAEIARNMYREIGLVVFLEPANVEEDDEGNIILSPIVSVTGRVEDEQFDFDRAQAETQAGLLDGVEGRILENGEWREPKRLL